MKEFLVISNTTFSIEKFREHYLSKISDYNFIIYTPNKIPDLKKNYKNITLKKFKSKNFLQDFKELYKILKKSHCSEIIVYSNKYQFIVSLLKKIFNLKINILSVIAGRGSLNLGNIFEKFFYYSIIKKIIDESKIVICINPDDLNYFKKFSKKDKFYLLPTEGVEKIKFREKSNNKTNFIFFGRLIKEKGILEYIEVAKKLKKKYPKKKFFIAGPSDQRIIGQSKFDDKTLELIKRNSKYVKYIGYIDNFKSIFPKMDCLISPSFSEGAGTSVMEAMMSGLHVIVYQNSGHNYVLKDTKNIITKKNTVNYLVSSIEKFINLKNNELNQSRKISYNKIINNFSSEIVSNRFNKILDLNYKIIKKDIDIIWPYYKDRKFLNHSISLINNQSLQPKRLIFIDDANNDHLLKGYIRNRLNRNIEFIYIKNKINFGVTKSVSIGVKRVKSKYLYIQSTDDIIYENFLELNVRALEKNKKAAYVFSNIRINNLDNKKKYFINFSFIKENYINKTNVSLLYNDYQFKIYHNTVVFNSKKILNSNIFKNEFGRRADMLNLQYLSMKYGFCYLDKAISEFTIRKGQVSSTLLSDEYLIKELKYIKKMKRQFYNFIIKNNLHYEISPFKLIKFTSNFGNIITIKYLSRSIKFKLWKLFRFYINPKILNFLFKILN
ncbi:glycosyltransferase [Pelagibacterales bacterium SAG-MED03]|nr:glycosyltransferase [Pelagibacterales bacterium SAG-MED03]